MNVSTKENSRMYIDKARSKSKASDNILIKKQ